MIFETMLQSNLDYPHLNYPDFSIIRTYYPDDYLLVMIRMIIY